MPRDARETPLPCRCCGRTVLAAHAEAALCSKSWVNRALRMPSLEERFPARVQRRGDDECWPWLGPKKRGGYGSMKWSDGRYHLAHRIAWALDHDYMPGSNMHVCHSCDNPSCCNPRHLWLGSPLDNVSDRDAKRRTSQGERHYAARLTVDDVVAIRRSTETLTALARRFGVSISHIRNIRQETKW